MTEPATNDEHDRPTAEAPVAAPAAGVQRVALRFTHGFGTSGPTPLWMDLADVDSLAAEAVVPTAYVVSEADIGLLPELDEKTGKGVKNRGKKNPTKSLQVEMMNGVAPGAITADYSNPGQLERGVRALLDATFCELTGTSRLDAGVKALVATAFDELAGGLEGEVRKLVDKEFNELMSDSRNLEQGVGRLLEAFRERTSRTGKLDKDIRPLLKAAFDEMTSSTGDLEARVEQLLTEAAKERMSDTGKLEASVRELLTTALEERKRELERLEKPGNEQARRRKVPLLYFIGVREEVFGDALKGTKLAPRIRKAANEPVSSRVLLDVIERAEIPDVPRPPSREEQDLGRTPEEIVGKRFVGSSLETRLIRQLILRAAQTPYPVLILGETGTGKEAVSRAIHDASGRKSGPFIAVNCAAIPTELFESEVFGIEPGGADGVKYRRDGLWKMADEGTLFLDELGDLALHHQGKILRALEDGAIRPIGWHKREPIRVDARILAATNRDIIAQVRAGQFREDLYYRLRPFLIRTTPLRDHPDDIPELANWFWRTKICGGDDSAKLDDSILEDMKLHSWPGNAREVKAILMSMRSLFGTQNLKAKHLRAVFHLQGHVLSQSPSSARRHSSGMERAMERLEHLGLVDDALRATRASLDRNPYGYRALLGQHLDELAPLLQQDLFSRAESWTLVETVRSRLAGSPEQPDESWRMDTIAACDAALAALDQDAQTLVDPDLHVGQ